LATNSIWGADGAKDVPEK